MAEDWIGKMIAFLIVFFVVTFISSAIFGWNWQIGVVLGLVGSAALAGVALRK